jgi:hypothetical protein
MTYMRCSGPIITFKVLWLLIDTRARGQCPVQKCYQYIYNYESGGRRGAGGVKRKRKSLTSQVVLFPACEGTWRAMNSTLTAVLSVGGTYHVCVRAAKHKQPVP